MTAPKYDRIEFCQTVKTLWGKIESGHWDWLGVHPEGKFVLGSPPAPGGLVSKATADLIPKGAAKHEYGVGSRGPLSARQAFSWYRTRGEAAAGFDEKVREASDESLGPGLVRVRQYEHGEWTREKYVVRRPSTYR